jgi:hypothetical protein
LKALGVLYWAKISVVGLASFVGVVGCSRTDFLAFDEFDEAAGASGTDTGGQSSGGTNTGGFSGVGGTSGSSGTSGTGAGGFGGTGVCRDGRELCGNQCVLTESDPNHCGGCFYTCPDFTECIRGVCTPRCDGSTYCNGICTDITRDPNNCGGCGYECLDGHTCRSGYCSDFCTDESILCDGVCVDWRNDPMNCGGCGHTCGRGMSPRACFEGTCRCAGNQVDCGSGCTDVRTDPENCGGCGYACAPGQFCIDGICQFECPPGFALCGDVCSDLTTDQNHCGICGRSCAFDEYCNFGTCTPRTGTVTYSVGPSPLPFVNACLLPGWYSLLGGDVDDSVASLMLPFTFRFYDIQTLGGWVSSNGVLGFNTPTPDFQNMCSPSSVRYAVMAFWDDLATRQPGVCVALTGTSPNRQFVVTWPDAFILGIPASHLNFSVVLNEGSGIIDVLYGTMSGAGALSAGQDATIGLASQMEYALDCCLEPCVTSNSGRRYTPEF